MWLPRVCPNWEISSSRIESFTVQYTVFSRLWIYAVESSWILIFLDRSSTTRRLRQHEAVNIWWSNPCLCGQSAHDLGFGEQFEPSCIPSGLQSHWHILSRSTGSNNSIVTNKLPLSFSCDMGGQSYLFPIISSKRSMQMFGRCSLEDMIVWTWENFFTWGYDTSLSLSAPLSQAFITKYSLQWQLWRILLSLVIEVQRSVKWPVPEGCHERWEICSAKCVGHPI